MNTRRTTKCCDFSFFNNFDCAQHLPFIFLFRYPHFRESMVETIESRKREHMSSGGSGLGTTLKEGSEGREFNALLQSATAGDEELGKEKAFTDGREDEKSDTNSIDGSHRPSSSPILVGGK